MPGGKLPSQVRNLLFKQKLGELAEAEKRSGVESKPGEGFAGEGLPGEIDPGEPEAIRAMRARLRVLHHPKSTETAYVSWVQRFIRHLDDEHLLGHKDVKTTTIYTHVMNRPGLGVRSPLDWLDVPSVASVTA